jgi:hypothetical protein
MNPPELGPVVKIFSAYEKLPLNFYADLLVTAAEPHISLLKALGHSRRQPKASFADWF